MPALELTEDRSPALAGLRLHSITKTFPGTRALDDVSFDVPRATIHALLGGNGSGKSTLIKVLAGVETGDPGGTVGFGKHQQRSEHITPVWAAACGLRFVHQDLGLFEHLSVAENIYAGRQPPRRAGRIDWSRMRREAQLVLDRLQIDVDACDSLARIRPADRTLVAIARAVPAVDDMADTLLVLDEPTARLAATEAETLLEALRRYVRHGQTILFVSHRLEEVFELARAVTILRDGRHVHTDVLAGMDEAAVVALMIGRSLTPRGREPARRSALSQRRGAAPVLRVAGLADGPRRVGPRRVGPLRVGPRRVGPRRVGPLRGVDLAVSAGEILGVAGLVGAGRTELLQAIFGACGYEQGSVELDGRRLPPGRIDVAIRRGISLVPEDRAGEGMFASLGIPENLSASDSGRYRSRMIFRRGRERRDAASMIERMGIRAPGVTASLASLSGGNQQKVVLGRWLAMAPRLLLLDEPTQGVDVAARHDLHRQIETMARDGCAVLLISSDLDELLGLADRVVVLAGGRIAAEADASRLSHAWLGTHMYASTPEGAAA